MSTYFKVLKIYKGCTLKKNDASKNNFEGRIIFPFSQEIKRKQKYEKEGRDIHIIRITTTFGCQQVIFFDIF